jgi:Ribbon-helix-helix protein, copG family
MSTPGVDQGGRPRTQGREDDPLVTVSLHVRKSQLSGLDQLADAAHTSRAALVREAIDRLLTRLKRPSSWRTGGASATRSTPLATTTT